MIRFYAAAGLAFSSAPCFAQVASTPPTLTATTAPAAPTAATLTAQAPASAVILAPAATNVLRAGTEIPLITREELTTKKK